MSKLFAIAVPVTRGKEGDFKKFVDELNGRYYNDFVNSRKKLNVRERTFHQKTPMGEFVIVTLEGDNPEQAFYDLGKGNDEFTKWLAQKVKDFHNIDITQPPPPEIMPKPATDTNNPQTTGNTKLTAFFVPVVKGKETQWKEFLNDLNNRWKKEFNESRKRLNVRERVFTQETPEGSFTIVTLEGADPEKSMIEFGKGNDDFTAWFNQKAKEIHNYDMTQPPPFPLPELIVDSNKKLVKV